jgi:hypothetical protein
MSESTMPSRIFPRQPLAQRQDAVEMIIHRVQHPLDLLVGEKPPVGQRESRAPALAEAEAQPLFEFGHVKRNRRGRGVEHALRSGQAAGFDDCPENAQETNVDIGEASHAVSFVLILPK